MGNSCCCDTVNQDEVSYIYNKEDFFNKAYGENDYYQTVQGVKSSTMTEYGTIDSTTRLTIKEIINIQKTVRGFLFRKYYKKGIIKRFKQIIPQKRHSERNLTPKSKSIKGSLNKPLSTNKPLEINNPLLYKDNITRMFPKLSTDNGETAYEGEWCQTKKNGFGLLEFRNGSFYKGFFQNDIAHGLGVYYSNNRTQYYGLFSKGKTHGFGMFKNLVTGYFYQGQWYEDKQSDFGIENYSNKSNYTGEFDDGIKHGIGMLTLADGSFYAGMLAKNKINGVGVLRFADNKLYEGEWKDNQMHGFGTLTYSYDRCYEGEFKYDQKDGFGVFTHGKKTFIGIFKEDKLFGEACIVDEDDRTITNTLWNDGKKIMKLDQKSKYSDIAKKIMRGDL